MTYASLSPQARRLLWAAGAPVVVAAVWIVWTLSTRVETLSEEAQLAAAVQAHRSPLEGQYQPNSVMELQRYPVPIGTVDPPMFEVRLNRFSLRDRDFDPKPPPGKVRIIALGDSVTFGTGVPVEHRFTEQLAALLEARRPGCCEVLNAGRAGMSTSWALETLKSSILDWSPSLLILGTLTNDIRDPKQPTRLRVARSALRAYEVPLRKILDLCKARGIEVVLWGNTLSGRPGDDPLRPLRFLQARVAAERGLASIDIDKVYSKHPATPEEQKAYLADRPFSLVWPKASRGPIGRLALLVDWAHPNRFGHRRLAEALLPAVLEALDRERLTPE